MTFSLDTVSSKAIAALNLSYRDVSGTPTYGLAMSDLSYSADEITRAAQSAVTKLMEAICETDGHGDRHLFQSTVTLTAGVLPAHRGSIGVPQITPYSGAGYKLAGKRKSMEEIAAYKANPRNLYSVKAHNLAHNGFPSKIAGCYAIDAATKRFDFTGYAAEAEIVDFEESDYTSLPDRYYPDAMYLCIADLKKDGDASDIFSSFEQKAMNAIANIRSQGVDQPSPKKTIGSRDSGSK